MKTLPQLRSILLEVRMHLVYGRHECALALLNETVTPGEDSSARSSGTPGVAAELEGDVSNASPHLVNTNAVLGLLNSQWPHTWAEQCEIEHFGSVEVCVTHGQNMPCPIPAAAALVSGKQEIRGEQ